MTVAETFHAFMIRKTLLTHWSVCFEFSMPGATFRDPIIRNTAASSLYVDLLSLLDEAIEAHMSPEDYDRGRKMKNRLEMLAKEGALLDLEIMKAINGRRNEIGHDFDKGATVQELNDAVGKVKKQLLSWGMIEDVGDYELAFERSAARGSEDEQTAFEQDMIIRVKTGREVWLEMKQTRKFGKTVS